MKRLSVISACALSLALTTGCGSDAENSDGAGGTGSTNEIVRVEVFSWWTAPGEAEALQSLVDLHRKTYKNTRIFNAATDPAVLSGGTEAKQLLQERLEAGDPPDAFQTNAYELKLGYLANEPNLLEPLDDLFAEQGLTDDIAPELLSDITIKGHPVAVPVNVHRENSLFYNKQLFTENDIVPPTTMSEFLEVCAKLKEAGVTPLAISTSQAWIINKVFMSLALGTLGADKFNKYFVAKEPVEEADFAPVVATLDEVLRDYIDTELAASDGYGWTQAADSLRAGKAAMFIHGDWAKGYLTQLGWTPEVDFGVSASPGADGAFIYGMDVFAVPTGAPHREDAFNWLRTIASPEGQISFNEAKGSSPVRLNIDSRGLDAMARATYADLKNAAHRVPAVGVPSAWDEGFQALAKDHDQAALLKTFADNPMQ